MNLLLISVLSLLLQQQEGPPGIILKSEGFTLEANSIDSKPTEYGIIYVIKSPRLRGEEIELIADKAVIETDSIVRSQKLAKWSGALISSIGLENKKMNVKKLQLEGSVVLSTEYVTFKANSLKIEPKTGSSIFKDLSAIFGPNTIGPNGWPVHLEAQLLTEYPNGELEFINCTITTCTKKTPHYSTSFNSIRATPQGDDKTLWRPEGAWLKIFNVPILPLPSIDFIDGENFFGLSGIDFGSSRITGQTIKPFFGGKKELGQDTQYIWSIAPAWSSLRGYPLYAEAEYISKDWKSSILLFGLNDSLEQDFSKLNTVVNRNNSGRYIFDWHNTITTSKDSKLIADVVGYSDHLVYPEFFRPEWASRDDRESAIEWVREKDNNYFSAKYMLPNAQAGFTPLDGFLFNKQQYQAAPNISFRSYSQPFKWAPSLQHSFQIEASKVSSINYPIINATTLNRSQTRLAGTGFISNHFNLNGLQIIPKLTFHNRLWTDEQSFSVQERQMFTESSLAINTLLVRRYADGWKHKVLPTLTWRAQNDLGNAGEGYLIYGNNRELKYGRMLELGVRQMFYAPAKNTPWLDCQLIFPYYLGPTSYLASSLSPFPRTEIDNGLGAGELQLIWNPGTYGEQLKGLSLFVNWRHHVKNQTREQITAGLTMQPKSNYFYGVNYTEAKETENDFAIGSAFGGLRLGEEWAASLRKSKNFYGNAGFFSTWELRHYAHDFIFEIGYTQIEATGEDGFYFSISPRFTQEIYSQHDYTPRDF